MTTDPTAAVNVNFADYVAERTARQGAHLDGGIPDYAYAADYAIRRKIRAMPGVFPLFKAITASYVPFQKQLQNITALKVGPTQFPKIHAMVRDCAGMLGIGLPDLYVVGNIGELNAYTYAVEDADPIIILYSSIVERLDEDELRTVIGHECGHIHNNHGIYNTAATAVVQALPQFFPGAQQIFQAAAIPIKLALNTWVRMGEITCDRAGVICSGGVDPMVRSQAKLLSGAMLGQEALNIEAIEQQYQMMRTNPTRFIELGTDHPVSVRRIFAAKEFVDSEVYHAWHPDQRKPGATYLSKQELDLRCDRLVSVTKSKEV